MGRSEWLTGEPAAESSLDAGGWRGDNVEAVDESNRTRDYKLGVVRFQGRTLARYSRMLIWIW